MIGYARNEKGHLVIGGCDAVELAAQYGTPLFVMDEARIRATCRAFRAALDAHYPHAQILYASKAFQTVAMCKIVAQEGMGIDVVSGGELHVALTAGFPPERIYLHGNSKTDEEIAMALDHGIGCVVVDGFSDLRRLADAASKRQKRMRVLLRLRPGIEAHTHKFIQTATADAKFGLSLVDGQALRAVGEMLACPYLDVAGVHCHIGSQIFEMEPFALATEILLGFFADVKQAYGHEMSELNLGGGFGIQYVSGDAPLTEMDSLEAVAAAIRKHCAALGLSLPKLVIEPGRRVCGEAGTTLYRVEAVKDIPDVCTYVCVDGGMTDNIRPALYGAQYTCALANIADEGEGVMVSIAGRHCESSDILAKDLRLPRARQGDIVAMFSTGAYCYAMASQYNKTCLPAVVLVNDGRSALMVRRQTLDDLTARDCVPEWME